MVRVYEKFARTQKMQLKLSFVDDKFDTSTNSY